MKRPNSFVVGVDIERRSRSFGVTRRIAFLKLFETKTTVDTLLGLLRLPC
jgi:hypothetical protein